MKRITLPALLALSSLLLGACHTASPTACVGQPSWFSIGGWVYHEHDRDFEPGTALKWDAAPCWFGDRFKEVSRAECEAWEAARDAQDKRDGRRQGRGKRQEQEEQTWIIPQPVPYPKSAFDLPTDDRGVRLSLTADAQGADLRLTAMLHSDRDQVLREVEHRHTNLLPFLFAVYSDGKAVALKKPDAFQWFGGSTGFVPLVEPGHDKSWFFALDPASFAAVLPHARPQHITLIAAFCPTQYNNDTPGSKGMFVDWASRPTPFWLVRSEPLELEWDGKRLWVSPK